MTNPNPSSLASYARKRADPFRLQFGNGQQAQCVLCIELEGNGFKVLWTLDNLTWVDVYRPRPLNAHEAGQWLEKMLAENPDSECRYHVDFHGRIPEDLAVSGARVI